MGLNRALRDIIRDIIKDNIIKIKRNQKIKVDS